MRDHCIKVAIARLVQEGTGLSVSRRTLNDHSTPAAPAFLDSHTFSASKCCASSDTVVIGTGCVRTAFVKSDFNLAVFVTSHTALVQRDTYRVFSSFTKTNTIADIADTCTGIVIDCNGSSSVDSKSSQQGQQGQQENQSIQFINHLLIFKYLFFHLQLERTAGWLQKNYSKG